MEPITSTMSLPSGEIPMEMAMEMNSMDSRAINARTSMVFHSTIDSVVLIRTAMVGPIRMKLGRLKMEQMRTSMIH